MTVELMYSLAGPLVVMQFLALSWAVHQQIHVPDDEKQAVIALPDVLNILSLFATVAAVIVLPMATSSALPLGRAVLGGAYVLIAFYPLSVAAHHRLWRRKGQGRSTTNSQLLIYASLEEWTLTLTFAFVAAALAIWIGAH